MGEDRPNFVHAVTIPVGLVELAGDLGLPPGARGIVVFVHGSGSSRHSPRNQFVAHELHQVGLATLLFDLLTPAEEEHDRLTGEIRFAIGFLADRLRDVTEQVRRHPEARHLRIGYFGANAGAAAALVAAAERPADVAAIVSRGGRPDLAGAALEKVVAPTLLIVGEEDRQVLDLNEQAFLRLRCKKRLEIVPRATHLFEEPGTLDAVARLASEWFRHFLGAPTAPDDYPGTPPSDSRQAMPGPDEE
jgi:pimeloyl-ACP methyl ester carboxylesterase